MPRPLASAEWAENRSGRSSAPGLPALASCSWPPMAALLVMLVTLSRMPFSLPTVSLNSVSRRFMGESACSPYTCQMLSMVGSLGESRVLLPPQPASARPGTSAASFKNVLRSIFHDSFPHIAARGGNPAQAGLQLPVLRGKRPKIPPILGFLGGFFEGEAPKPQKFFWNCPPKTAFLRGQFFSGYGTVQPEKVLRRCRKPVAVHKTRQQASADSIHKDSIRWSGLQVQRTPKPEPLKSRGAKQKGAPP